MRTFGALCFSLLLSAVPATASDQNLKEELGKVASAYQQSFNKKDAAGLLHFLQRTIFELRKRSSKYNTQHYEDVFKAGFNNLEVKMTKN